MASRNRTLNKLQEQFCAEYVEDFDEAEAVRRAGYRYSSDTDLARIGGGLLTSANVLARIDELLLERAPLTEQQKWVARHYLQGGCGRTEACRRAGYKDDATLRVRASRLFSKPVFKAYLRDLQRSLMLRFQIDHDWVLRKARDWVESSDVALTDVANVHEDGSITLKNINQLPRHQVMGIEEIHKTEVVGEEGTIRSELRIKFHKRDTASLALIARSIGFGNDYNAALNTLHKYGFDMQESPDGSTLHGRRFDAEPLEEAGASETLASEPGVET